MPLVTRRCIEDIKLRADIVELAGDYTTLKRAGSKWKGLSPFQTEKTPSFHVDRERGLFYCFSTNQGGDVFKLVMLKDGLTFSEAVERVASRFGLALEYEKDSGDTNRSLRGRLLEIHEIAASHYRALFNAKTADAEAVRTYWLKTRRFTHEIAEAFRVGYAPPDGGNLLGTLLKSGYTKQELGASGLFVGMDYNPDPTRWRHRFRGRLMIPINDIQKRPVGFTARQLPGITPQDDPSHEAKYINSPETDLFQKSRILFNLDKAMHAAKERGAIVLVEGQLDAIRCYTNGVENAVASQGTAIGDEHVRLIARYAQRVDALLDADKAGQRAVLRLLPIAMQGGLDIRCISVPGGKDPDEYLANEGSKGWAAVEATATDAIEFATRALVSRDMLPAKKLQAVHEVFEITTKTTSALMRDSALATIARITGLDRASVAKEFSQFLKTQRGEHDTRTLTADPVSHRNEDSGPITVLLTLALQNQKLAEKLAKVIKADWIPDTDDGRMLNRLLGECEVGGWSQGNIESIAESEEEETMLCRLLATALPVEDIRKTVNECLRTLHKKRIEGLITSIGNEIAENSRDLPSEKLTELQNRRMALRAELRVPPEMKEI